MVKYSDVRAANAQYIKKQSLVVVSAGGTSGIGETTLRELCTLAGDDAACGAGMRIYMIGRKQEAVNKLITEFKSLASAAEFIFVHGKDLSLLKGVDEVCQDIIQAERARVGDAARIDLLIQTQAIFDPWLGRKETTEGIDLNLSLLYYSRARMVVQLLPLLTARSAADAPAHVIWVYAAGYEASGSFFKDDLSLRKNYGFGNARVHAIHMTTMFLEHIANDHPGKISLSHMHPGLVIHPNFSKLLTQINPPFWVRIVTPIFLPIAKVTIATPLPESGQRTLFLATDRYPAKPVANDKQASGTTASGLPIAVATNGSLGGGAYSVNQKDDTNTNLAKAYGKLRAEGFYDQVWNHTNAAFDAITTSKVFEG